MRHKHIAIVGTVGVPASYGGFETLVENLLRHHTAMRLGSQLTVYCSSKVYSEKLDSYLSAKLKYIPLKANGAQSILYDILSLLSAVWYRNHVILLLGVSGAIVLPLIRVISSARIVTNLDGIEWRRQKWRGLAKYFLYLSEKMAVYFSHEVIADNEVIADYIRQTYDVESHVIAYGGDHAYKVVAVQVDEYELPETYVFSLCRIVPENNVHMILEAFAHIPDVSLVIVGNWDSSNYGKALQIQYGTCTNIWLLDPIYDQGKLKTLRSQARLYIHGHSAGGTNPSLVEAMSFGCTIVAFDCSFNRSTTGNKAIYFNSAEKLSRLVTSLTNEAAEKMGREMLKIAIKHYKWDMVAGEYFSLIRG